MNILLIFFAFPIAVIIFSIVLERLLKCPVAVASLIFAIFLIITFAAFDETFLIATLVYTIIAFITAAIVHFLRDRRENDICNLLSNLIQNNNLNNSNNNTDDSEDVSEAIENIISNNNNNNSQNTCNCGCNRYRRRF